MNKSYEMYQPLPTPNVSIFFAGEYVYVGENSIINSAQIGSYVHIGKDCVLGRLTMLKDCCAILDGTVLPPDTVVPPFAVFAGNPGRQVGELPEITQELMIDFTWSFYRNMLPMSKKPKEDEGNTPRWARIVWTVKLLL